MPSTILPFSFESSHYDAVITTTDLDDITIFKVMFDHPAILKVFGKEFQYMYKDQRLISLTPQTNQNGNMIDYFHQHIIAMLLNDPEYDPEENATGIEAYDPSKM